MLRAKIAVFLACVPLLALTSCKNDEVSSYKVTKTAGAGQDMPQSMPQGIQGAPSSMPMGGASDMSSVSLPPPPSEAHKAISWKTPKGWREVAPSEMRIGSFLIDGKNGLQADVSIVVLSGPAGGDLANINRWRGQLNLASIAEGELTKHSKKISPAGRPMLMSNFVTTDLDIDNRYKKRLVAVTYPRGGNTWFFKMTGEDALVRSIEPAFMSFLENLRFNDPQ
jgi:hypothetical protein